MTSDSLIFSHQGIWCFASLVTSDFHVIPLVKKFYKPLLVLLLKGIRKAIQATHGSFWRDVIKKCPMTHTQAHNKVWNKRYIMIAWISFCLLILLCTHAAHFFYWDSVEEAVLYGIPNIEPVLPFLRLKTIQEAEKTHFPFPESAWVICSRGLMDHLWESQPFGHQPVGKNNLAVWAGCKLQFWGIVRERFVYVCIAQGAYFANDMNTFALQIVHFS